MRFFDKKILHVSKEFFEPSLCSSGGFSGERGFHMQKLLERRHFLSNFYTVTHFLGKLLLTLIIYLVITHMGDSKSDQRGTWGFFTVYFEKIVRILGGQTCSLRIVISSHKRVQMGRELVRLIDLIHLNMFTIRILYWKSSETFSWTRFERSSLKIR